MIVDKITYYHKKIKIMLCGMRIQLFLHPNSNIQGYFTVCEHCVVI